MNEANAIDVFFSLDSLLPQIHETHLPTCFIRSAGDRQCYDFPFLGVVAMNMDSIDEFLVFFWSPRPPKGDLPIHTIGETFAKEQDRRGR